MPASDVPCRGSISPVNDANVVAILIHLPDADEIGVQRQDEVDPGEPPVITLTGLALE